MRWSRHNELLEAVLGGLLVAASLPPMGWWPLAIGGFALFIHATAAATVARRALVGYVFGIAYFTPSLLWMIDFHAIGFVVAVVVEAGFYALATAAVPARSAPLGLTASFVLAEAVRSAVPFGGLPVVSPALGQVSGPLVPAARLGGALLITLVLLLTARCLFLLVSRSLERELIVFVVAIAATVGAGLVLDTGRTTGSLRVTTVQGGGERGFRGVDTDPARVFRRHLNASSDTPDDTELVLWPENVVDLDSALSGTKENEAIARLANEHGVTLIAGVTEPTVNGQHFRNFAAAWSPDGGVVDEYEKVQRVPFGEYIPGRSWIDGFVDLSAVPRDAVAGTGDNVLRTPSGTYAVTISYEVFFARRAREGVRAGGEVLLVPTNAASYKSSQIPTIEVAAARLRAWETNRAVVQAAPTGFSAIVRPDGSVMARSDLGRRALLHGTVPTRTGMTPYMWLGDTPVVSIAAVLLMLAWRPKKLRG